MPCQYPNLFVNYAGSNKYFCNTSCAQTQIYKFQLSNYNQVWQCYPNCKQIFTFAIYNQPTCNEVASATQRPNCWLTNSAEQCLAQSCSFYVSNPKTTDYQFECVDKCPSLRYSFYDFDWYFSQVASPVGTLSPTLISDLYRIDIQNAAQCKSACVAGTWSFWKDDQYVCLYNTLLSQVGDCKFAVAVSECVSSCPGTSSGYTKHHVSAGFPTSKTISYLRCEQPCVSKRLNEVSTVGSGQQVFECTAAACAQFLVDVGDDVFQCVAYDDTANATCPFVLNQTQNCMPNCSATTAGYTVRSLVTFCVPNCLLLDMHAPDSNTQTPKCVDDVPTGCPTGFPNHQFVANLTYKCVEKAEGCNFVAAGVKICQNSCGGGFVGAANVDEAPTCYEECPERVSQVSIPYPLDYTQVPPTNIIINECIANLTCAVTLLRYFQQNGDDYLCVASCTYFFKAVSGGKYCADSCNGTNGYLSGAKQCYDACPSGAQYITVTDTVQTSSNLCQATCTTPDFFPKDISNGFYLCTLHSNCPFINVVLGKSFCQSSCDLQSGWIKSGNVLYCSVCTKFDLSNLVNNFPLCMAKCFDPPSSLFVQPYLSNSQSCVSYDTCNFVGIDISDNYCNQTCPQGGGYSNLNMSIDGAFVVLKQCKPTCRFVNQTQIYLQVQQCTVSSNCSYVVNVSVSTIQFDCVDKRSAFYDEVLDSDGVTLLKLCVASCDKAYPCVDLSNKCVYGQASCKYVTDQLSNQLYRQSIDQCGGGLHQLITNNLAQVQYQCTSGCSFYSKFTDVNHSSAEEIRLCQTHCQGQHYGYELDQSFKYKSYQCLLCSLSDPNLAYYFGVVQCVTSCQHGMQQEITPSYSECRVSCAFITVFVVGGPNYCNASCQVTGLRAFVFVNVLSAQQRKCLQTCASNEMYSAEMFMNTPLCVSYCPITAIYPVLIKALNPQRQCTSSCVFMDPTLQHCVASCSTAYSTNSYSTGNPVIPQVSVQVCTPCTTFLELPLYMQLYQCSSLCASRLYLLVSGKKMCQESCVLATPVLSSYQCQACGSGECWTDFTSINSRVCQTSTLVDQQQQVMGIPKCSPACTDPRPLQQVQSGQLFCVAQCFAAFPFVVTNGVNRVCSADCNSNAALTAGYILSQNLKLCNNETYANCDQIDDAQAVSSVGQCTTCGYPNLLLQNISQFQSRCVPTCSFLVAGTKFCKSSCSDPNGGQAAGLQQTLFVPQCYGGCKLSSMFVQIVASVQYCVAQCDDTQPLLTVTAGKTVCTAACDFVVNNSGQFECQPCSLQYYQITVQKVAARLCAACSEFEDLPYNGINVCVEQCPDARPIILNPRLCSPVGVSSNNYVDSKNNSVPNCLAEQGFVQITLGSVSAVRLCGYCGVIVNVEMFLETGSQMCVYKCPASQPLLLQNVVDPISYQCKDFCAKVDSGMRCTARSCNYTAILVNGHSVQQCQSACQFPSQYQLEMQCLMMCPSLVSFDNSCVTNCEMTAMRYTSHALQQIHCESCPVFADDRTGGLAYEWLCVTGCPGVAYVYDASATQCNNFADRCTLFNSSHWFNKKQYGARPFSVSGECQASCPGFASETSLVCSSGCGTVYQLLEIFGAQQRICKERCDLGWVSSSFQQLSGVKSCQQSCEKPQIQEPGLRACVDLCETLYFKQVGANLVCASPCSVFQVAQQQRQCVLQCASPNMYQVINGPETVCAPSCPWEKPFTEFVVCQDSCASKVYTNTSSALLCAGSCQQKKIASAHPSYIECVAYCTDIEVFATQFCVEESYINTTDPNCVFLYSKFCIGTCEFFILPTTLQQCVYQCAKYVYDQFCVDSCQPDRYYNHSICVVSCSENQMLGQNQNCTYSCPISYLGTCFHSCPARTELSDAFCFDQNAAEQHDVQTAFDNKLSSLEIGLITAGALVLAISLTLLILYVRHLWKRCLRSGKNEWFSNEPKLVKKALDRVKKLGSNRFGQRQQ